MKFLQKNRTVLLLFCLLFILTIPVLLPLLHKGFFLSDDGEWMIIRFSAFHQAFREGQFPVRYLPRLNFGYGYPVANFLYPGFLYLSEVFKLAGFGFVASVKFVIGLSLAGSTFFTFLWLAKRFSFSASFIGSLIYLYTPYHLYDAYKRGSVGELLALAIMPFILWNIERKSVLWISLGIGFLLLSHNTLAIFFIPLILLYMTILIFRENERRKLVLLYASTLVMGFGVAAFFWIPALVELQYTRFSSVTVSDISQYFASVDLIGAGSLFVFGMSLFFLAKKQKSTIVSLLLLLFTIITALSIFYSSSFSRFIWDYLPASFIQFPFRLLSYLIIGVSFLSAYTVSYFKGRMQQILSGLLLLFVVFSAVPFLSPKEYFDKGEGFYATNEDTTTVKHEYMPRWVKADPKEHVMKKVEIIKGKGEISNILSTAKKISFDIAVFDTAVVRVNTIYYPGWKVFVDGTEVEADHTNDKGVMDVVVKKNQERMEVSFTETPLRNFANLLSLLSLGGIIIFSSFRLRLWKLS